MIKWLVLLTLLFVVTGSAQNGGGCWSDRDCSEYFRCDGANPDGNPPIPGGCVRASGGACPGDCGCPGNNQCSCMELGQQANPGCVLDNATKERPIRPIHRTMSTPVPWTMKFMEQLAELNKSMLVFYVPQRRKLVAHGASAPPDPWDGLRK